MIPERSALDLAQPLTADRDQRATVYILKALAHEKRARILYELAQADAPLTVREVQHLLAGRGDALAHLQILRDAGFVEMVGRGKAAKWGLVDGALQRAAALIN